MATAFLQKVTDFVRLSVEHQTKMIPATSFKYAYQAQIVAEEQASGYPMSKRDKQDLKDRLFQEWLSKALCQTGRFDVLIDLKNNLMLITTHQEKKLNQTLALIKRTFPELEIDPLFKKDDVSELLREVFYQGHRTFDLAKEWIITSPNKQHRIQFRSADEMIQALQDQVQTLGYDPQTATLAWNDVLFKLKSNGQIGPCKGFSMEHEYDKENPCIAIDSTFYLSAQALFALTSQLKESLKNAAPVRT